MPNGHGFTLKSAMTMPAPAGTTTTRSGPVHHRRQGVGPRCGASYDERAVSAWLPGYLSAAAPDVIGPVLPAGNNARIVRSARIVQRASAPE